ncbi:hypothetical protein [Mucilaginibacter sp.]
MAQPHFITGSCIISNYTVHLNGVQIYRSAETELSAFLLSVYQHFQFSYPKFYKMDNLSKLGWLTAELLLQGKPLLEKYTAEKVGLVLSNASSSLDADLRYSDTMNEAASPALFVYTLPNIVIGEICIRHKFKGENAFFITEQFNVGLLETQVNLLLDAHILQACICGWVEALGQNYQSGLFLVEQAGDYTPAVFTAKQLTALMNNSHE